jgi:hypothetical protein
MTDPQEPAPPTPTPDRPTLRAEIKFVIVISVVMMVLIGIDCWNALGRGMERHPPLLSLLAALVNAFANAMWITMDRKRRGREVGWRRFAAVFFGPPALAVYILLEYRQRALIYRPLLAGVYLGTWCFPVIGVFLLRRAGF